MSEAPTHYALLGVPADADEATIKAAYRAAARASHPDVGGEAAESAAVSEAYRVLSDPVTRAAYDHRLGAEERAAAAERAGEFFARLHPRTWSALCYLAPVPGFPVAFFVGGRGLWGLRFHASQAFLTATVAAVVVGMATWKGFGLPALGGAAVAHLGLAVATKKGLRPRVPGVSRVASGWADRGGRR